MFVLLFSGCSLKEVVRSNNVEVVKADEQEREIDNQIVTDSNNDLLYTTNVNITTQDDSFRIELHGIDGYAESISIISNINSTLNQRFNVSNHIGPINDTFGLDLNDFNFDGYMDIRLQQVGGVGANTLFDYWLWNKEESKFVFSKSLSELTAVSFYPEDKIIVSENQSSAGFSYIEEVYVYVGNEIQLTKVLVREWNIESETFDYKFYEVIDGDKILVYETTDDFTGEEWKRYEHFGNKKVWDLSALKGDG